MLGFKTFLPAERTLKGIEAMHMIRKGQAVDNSSALSAVEWVNKIFGLEAQLMYNLLSRGSNTAISSLPLSES